MQNGVEHTLHCFAFSDYLSSLHSLIFRDLEVHMFIAYA